MELEDGMMKEEHDVGKLPIDFEESHDLKSRQKLIRKKKLES